MSTAAATRSNKTFQLVLKSIIRNKCPGFYKRKYSNFILYYCTIVHLKLRVGVTVHANNFYQMLRILLPNKLMYCTTKNQALYPRTVKLCMPPIAYKKITNEICSN